MSSRSSLPVSWSKNNDNEEEVHPQLYSAPHQAMSSKGHRQVLLLALMPAFLLLLALMTFDTAQGCGFPPPAAPTTCCCGGGGGGCGRKKREAIQPHYKGAEVPCPQTEWRQVMESAILSADDQSSSLAAVQNAFLLRFPAEKFLVTCAMAQQQAAEQNAVASKIEAAKQLPHAIHFSSAGDGYCNVLTKGQWCQAVALSA